MSSIGLESFCLIKWEGVSVVIFASLYALVAHAIALEFVQGMEIISGEVSIVFVRKWPWQPGAQH